MSDFCRELYTIVVTGQVIEANGNNINWNESKDFDDGFRFDRVVRQRIAFSPLQQENNPE